MICHDTLTITASVSTSITRFDSTPDSVEENACCALTTSLFSRDTSAPVRVRMKNATGIRCTWSNTAVRKSRISPSPMRDDSHRETSPSAASATAITAISTASTTTTRNDERTTIASTTQPASTGVATASTAVTTLSRRNHASLRLCGRAKRPIRRNVAAENGRRSSVAFIVLYSDIHAVVSMSMTPPSHDPPTIPGADVKGSTKVEVNSG